MKKYLVTGSTGYIGRYLVRRLSSSGNMVRCLVRNPDKHSGLISDWDKELVEVLEGDITEKKSLNGIAEGIHTVFHLAASDTREINVDGTLNILHQFINKPIRRFIHFSTMDVYGSYKKDGPIDENDKPDPKTSYQVTKMKGENLALDFFKRHKVPVTAIRPTMVYGRDRKKKGIIEKSVDLRIVPIIGDGSHKMNMVHVDDLIEVAILASEKGRPGEVYNIIGKDVTWDGFVNHISKKEQKKIVKLHIPYMLAKYPLKLLQIFYAIDTDRIESMKDNRTFSGEKAKKELNYVPTKDPLY